MTTTLLPGAPPAPPAAAVDVAPVSAPRSGGWHRALRRRPGDPAWARPAFFALLGLTAVLYLWGLGASGWANAFYSAAVQAGTKSWKAFFFGSSDASNFIAVDKTPGSLWVMGISARIFGVNSWSILVPQALEGVAAVALLYGTVRRWFGPAAGLIAGAVMATAPAAALMFRFNNPDALLVLALVAAAYCLVRGLEDGRTRWIVAVGTLIGIAFLAKMLQAFVIVPGFAAVYLVAAPGSIRRRLAQVAAGGAALLVSAGWWVLAVELIPAGSRPYIGGSQSNSVLDLIFGYAGFGRLTGDETGSVGGGAGGSRWGATGLTRLFHGDMGGQISWLLPTSLVLLGAGLILRGRAPRTDRTRAALLLWGGWLVVTGTVFSLGQGIIHPYYTVALAPAIGAVIGIGAVTLWARRHDQWIRNVLAAAVAVSGIWSAVLLGRTPGWNGWLRAPLVIAGLLVAAALVAPVRLRGATAAGVIGLSATLALAGPTAYAVATAATTHSGAIPSAGPPGAAGGGRGGFTRGGFGGPAARAPGQGGGAGGLLDATVPPPAVITALQAGGDQFDWVLATAQSERAAGYQLATDFPVMALGGFNGTDPAPTLAQFQRYVGEGRIHYFLAGAAGGGGAGPPGALASPTATTVTQITAWVESHFASTTVGNVSLYDLTAPPAGGSQ